MDSPETTDDARAEGRANPIRSAWRVVAILFALCLLYILSIGPAAGLLMLLHGGANHTAARCFETFYAPVMSLGECTPLGEPLDWYIRWWLELG
jgi:hypothetical protein